MHEFSCFFTKWTTFSNLFLKSSSKCKNMVVCSKSCKVLAKSMIFCAFSKWGSFCNFLLKSSSKHQNMVVCSKKLRKFLPNRWVFVLFHKIEFLLKSASSKHGSFLEKLQVLTKSKFSCFFTKWTPFSHLFLKSSSKCKKIDDFSCVFTEWGTFCNFCWKVHENSKTW